ncbi:MAG: AIM24 family protein [Bacteroidetes bacterium]|nr:AIM24 family protein [Bacteroidota bacterium]
MAFCSNCGTRFIEGAGFCPECGTKNTFAGAPEQPEYQPQPQTPPRQPEKVPVQFGVIKFEVVEKETLKFLKAEFENSAVRYESGGMYYMKGNLELEAHLPSAGGFLKSMVTHESAVKPVIRGSGTVWFEPSFGNFTILELSNEEWILDRGAYYASEMGIEIGSFTNKSFSGMFSGEGFFQTKVSGTGKVVILSKGPLETIDLNNEKLVVDGSFAVARQAGIQLTVARASKGIFGSMLSGEGIVNTFTGTGKVLIAPAANRYITMINYLSSIHHRVMQIKNS